MSSLDLPFPDYAIAIISVVVFIVIARLFLYAMKHYLSKYARATETPLDDEVVSAIQLPLYAALILLGFWLSFPFLQPYIAPVYFTLISEVYDAALVALAGLIVYKVFHVGIRWYGYTIAKRTKTRVDDVLIPIISKFGKLGIAIMVLLVVLRTFNIDITAPLAGLGIVGLALAFAAQDTVSNFIAGFFLMTDRPFGEGDTIQLPSGEVCEVIEIGIRRTRLYDVNTHNYVIVPNLDLSRWKIVNLNLPDRKLKLTISVSVASAHDLEKVRALILGAVLNSKYVTKNPQPEVFCTGFTSTATKLEVVTFIEDFSNRSKALDDVYTQINQAFAKENIKAA